MVLRRILHPRTWLAIGAVGMLAGLPGGSARAQAPAAPEPPWFGSVTGAVDLAPEKQRALCEGMWRALRQGRRSRYARHP